MNVTAPICEPAGTAASPTNTAATNAQTAAPTAAAAGARLAAAAATACPVGPPGLARGSVTSYVAPPPIQLSTEIQLRKIMKTLRKHRAFLFRNYMIKK